MSTVEIRFVGKDDVSSEIKDISGEIKDLDKATKAADKTSKGLFQSLGGFGKIAAGAGIGLAVTAVTGLGAALISGAQDARASNIIFAQSEAVIASTGGAAGVSAQHVADYASALSDAAGKSLFGDDQIAESTNLLLTFTNIKGTVLDAATAISVDMAQALGGAPADAAVALGKALNDPVQGISALSRVGVTFSEDQKAVIQAMVDTGNVAGAQEVILAELNKEFGGSAAAAAAAAGPMAQLSGVFGELAEGMAAKLLPVLDQFTTWLASPVVMEAITNIGEGLVDAVLASVDAFASFMVAIQPIVGFVSDNLTPILAALAAMLITVVVPAFITWAGTAATAAAATITALAPVIIPIAAIGAAVGLLVAAWDRDWGGMRTTLTAWWTGTVEPILTIVWEWLSVKLTAAVETLRDVWSVAWPAIQSVVATAYTYFSGTVWPWLQTALGNIRGWIGTARDAWVAAWGAISGAVQSAYSIISGVISTIMGLIQGAINQINALIRAINSIPGVNIPSIPSIGGGSGFGTRSLGSSTSISNSQTFNINAPGASMTPAQFEMAVRRALTSSGLAAELRTRTT